MLYSLVYHLENGLGYQENPSVVQFKAKALRKTAIDYHEQNLPTYMVLMSALVEDWAGFKTWGGGKNDADERVRKYLEEMSKDKYYCDRAIIFALKMALSITIIV